MAGAGNATLHCDVAWQAQYQCDIWWQAQSIVASSIWPLCWPFYGRSIPCVVCIYLPPKTRVPLSQPLQPFRSLSPTPKPRVPLSQPLQPFRPPSNPGSPCPSPQNLKGCLQVPPLNPKSPCPSPQNLKRVVPKCLNPKSPSPTPKPQVPESHP